MTAAKDYLSVPFRDLLADTAAQSPTPGGGSIAAYVGALAAALGRMAVNYTVGKPKYAAHEPRLQTMLEELRRCGEMFTQLATEDMAAYERYSAARKSTDPAEPQRALVTATAVPLEIVAVAATVLARLDEMKGLLNPYLLSDVQASAILTEAVAQAAALNVRTNLVQFASPADARPFQEQLDTLLDHCRQHKVAIISHVAPKT